MQKETKTELKHRVQADLTGYAHEWFTVSLESRDDDQTNPEYQAELVKQIKRLQRAFGYTSFNGLES